MGKDSSLEHKQQIYTSADASDWISENSIKLVWLLPPGAVTFVTAHWPEPGLRQN